MKFSLEKWIETYKKAASDMAPKGHGPSDGVVCLMATLRYIRDEMGTEIVEAVCGDVAAKDAKLSDEQRLEINDQLEIAIKDGFKELYATAADAKSMGGFACNASAAAASAKLKVAGTVRGVVDL